MPRPLRAATGEIVYHVLNRANARRPIFQQETDYVAFENTLAEAQKRVSMRILAWCLMPNHWHLVLWPRLDGELSEYMRLVTLMHTQRWHAHRSSTGTGHLYQGRFKSFAVQHDAHFLTCAATWRPTLCAAALSVARKTGAGPACGARVPETRIRSRESMRGPSLDPATGWSMSTICQPLPR